MKKNKGIKITLASLFIVISAFIGIFAFANSNDGKIIVSKNATKVYEGVDSTNKEKGRFAKVNLNVNANSYTTEETNYDLVDIVLILDGSGSMNFKTDGADCGWNDFNNKYNECSNSRLKAAKASATTFINSMMTSENIKVGLVEFSTNVNHTLALTNNKTNVTNFIASSWGANGATNLQEAVASAEAILASDKRTGVKKIVIMLTDGIPTMFTSNGHTVGTGSSDNKVCYKGRWSGMDQEYKCMFDSEKKSPSTAAKEEVSNLKNANTNADVYTIVFGNESDAATTLAKINPTTDSNKSHKYENLTAIDGNALNQTFKHIEENSVNNIGTNAKVVDVIPADFELTSASKTALENAGITITNNKNGSTTLTWNIGNIAVTQNGINLSYEVKAKDSYHGSMYTNESAILTATVADENPYYSGTNATENFEQPSVEIPAIVTDDSYKTNNSYITYGTATINGTSIKTNDLITNAKSDNRATITDEIIIVTNSNVVSTGNNTYKIYKNSKLQGTLIMNNDGTFKFTAEEGISGEVNFEYYIKTTISPYKETNYVYSNNAIVTLKINERSKISITGTKTWVDADNQDGYRPSSIIVKLMNGATEVERKTITASNEWEYTFTNLFKYELGHENDESKKINYTIQEENVNHYTVSYSGYNITNTHEVEKTTISGIKTWVDADNQDGKRPSSIIVKLMNGTTEVARKTVTASDEWKYTFANVNKKANGKDITYSILEENIDYYVTTYNGYNIINSYTPELYNKDGKYTVIKVWDDKDNQDGYRDTYKVTLTGKAKDKLVKTDEQTLTKDKLTYTWENLPKYSNGIEIEYLVTETLVPANYKESYKIENGKTTITNTHEVEKTTITGTKTWVDADNQDGYRPSSIIVKLMNGTTEVDRTTVTAKNNWKYTFENVNKKANGKDITYSVLEEEVEHYTTTYNGFNITNTHTPELYNKDGKLIGKKVWVDANNQDGLRPEELKIELYADYQEKALKSATIKASEKDSNNWSYEFTNLPKFHDGKEVVYTVEEVLTDELKNEYSESKDKDNKYILINTHNVKKISISGTKTWDDKDNQDGKRPESIIVRLMNGEKEIAFKEVKASDDWKYTFDNLDEYENGNKINYTISEDAIDNYSTKIDGYNIINTHEVEKITITGTKTWDDQDNQDGIRPESITINLKNGDEIVKTTTITETDKWTYTFENVDKYANGNEIKYSIEEVMDENTKSLYDVTITEDENDDHVFDIINHHIPETISFAATKEWNDDDNQDGLRPDYITVRLYANGEEVGTAKISTENNWTYSFENYPRYSNGEEIKYVIIEDEVKGYTSEINTDEMNDDNIINVKITNVHKSELISITIKKIWDDFDNKSGNRPSEIKIYLYADGALIKTIIINENDNWEKTLKDLPKYRNGEEIKYTISEEQIDGYESTIDGFIITNTFVEGEGEDEPEYEEEKEEPYKKPEIYTGVNSTVKTASIVTIIVGTFSSLGYIAYRKFN